jgi:hypothetical protein
MRPSSSFTSTVSLVPANSGICDIGVLSRVPRSLPGPAALEDIDSGLPINVHPTMVVEGTWRGVTSAVILDEIQRNSLTNAM